MFGQNPVRKKEPGNGSELSIQEVFYTLQGEGPFSGQPAVFVRLAGCNLRCYWCDTDFESLAHRTELDRLIDEIERVRPCHCDLVVITGGEPLRQNIAPLVDRLIGKGLRVQIETSGSLWTHLPLHPNLTVVCSPKTPKLEARIVPRISAFKYVVADAELDPDDGLPLVSTQRRGMVQRVARPQGQKPVFVMPRDDGDPTKNAANCRAAAQSALTFGYILTLQTHKLVGLS